MTQTTTTLQQIDDVIAELKTMAPQTEVPFLRSLGKCTILICSGPKSEIICSNSGDFEATAGAARAKFAAYVATRAEKITQSMAPAIIRLTDDNGDCTDAQLRGDGFDREDLKTYGPAATDRANAMADKGPFTIISTEGANAQ